MTQSRDHDRVIARGELPLAGEPRGAIAIVVHAPMPEKDGVDAENGTWMTVLEIATPEGVARKAIYGEDSLQSLSLALGLLPVLLESERFRLSQEGQMLLDATFPRWPRGSQGGL